MSPNEDNSHYEKILATGEVKCIDDEIPFEIPKSWEWCRLGQIVQINPKNKANDEVEAAFIPMELIDATYFSSYVFKIKKWKNIKSGFTHFANGDIAFAKITPCFQNRKSMILRNLPNGIGAGTTELKVLRPYSKTINDFYLLFFLESAYFVEQAIFKGTANQQRIISGYMETKLFPLPPISEQIRIAHKLEELLLLADKYNKSQVALKMLDTEIPKLMKQSILQEAIQGKLVPQDSNDEPATVLLERIREEKKKLVASGKLKKKDLTDSTIFKGDDNKYYEKCGSAVTCIESELPFEIPDSWRWCKIGDVFRHNNGKQLNKGNNRGVLMDYITTSNLYWNGFVLDSLKQMPFEDTEVERCQAEKGDLLVCEGGDVGRSCIWMYDKPIMLQNHIHKLRAYIPICTKYFYYIFYLYNLMGIIGGKGIGIQGFSSKALHNTRVPLPPKEEQYRIVEKVEQALTSIMSR